MSQNRSQAANSDELRVMIEGIVDQVLGSRLNEHLATWMTNNPQMNNYYPRLRYETTGGGGNNVGGHIRQSIEAYRQAEQYFNVSDTVKKSSGSFYGGLSGLGGVLSAYKTGDALGGLVSGAQLGGTIGAAVGFLAGLFSKGQDHWNRPKFADAKSPFEKSFTVNRGEDDPYDMPESYYFRTGYNPSDKIMVRIGNQQLDDHIRNSLTNSYAAQLQRGLVF